MLYADKVTIKNAIENNGLKLVQHNVQSFDCQPGAGKEIVNVACEMVLYQSILVIYNCNPNWYSLISYAFLLNRLKQSMFFCIFIHMQMLHYLSYLPLLLALFVSQLTHL